MTSVVRPSLSNPAKYEENITSSTYNTAEYFKIHGHLIGLDFANIHWEMQTYIGKAQQQHQQHIEGGKRQSDKKMTHEIFP